MFFEAKALGIERPKIRIGQAITNLNTLIYVLINLRTLHRVRQTKAARWSHNQGWFCFFLLKRNWKFRQRNIIVIEYYSVQPSNTEYCYESV